jgi:hypothetical protein
MPQKPLPLINRAFQVNCVPKNDGSHQQVEAAGPITLALEAAIAHFAQTLEEHSLSVRFFPFREVRRFTTSDAIPWKPFDVAGKTNSATNAISITPMICN